MKEKFLPIGSVVMLDGATKRVMITGYLSVDKNNSDVVYDYSGCMYPEGILGSDQTLLFNHDQIAKIYFTGFIDDEQKEFSTKLIDIAKDIQTQQLKDE